MEMDADRTGHMARTRLASARLGSSSYSAVGRLRLDERQLDYSWDNLHHCRTCYFYSRY